MGKRQIKRTTVHSVDEQVSSILAFIKAQLPSLGPTDRLIGEHVLGDPERVVSSSISALKQYSGASVGSIVSFCRRMGANGFGDFKIKLVRELAQKGFPTAGQGLDTNGGPSLFHKVFEFHAECLRETMQLNSESTLQKAAGILKRAKRIEFFSIGLSNPVAYTASSKLRLIGLPCGAEIDSHMQLIIATQLKKGDVAFGISCSGKTRETVQCVEIARERKATVLCLTNCMNSPITRSSDLVLLATPSEIKYFQAPLASRVTQLALMDILFVAIAKTRKNRTLTLLQRAGEELFNYRV